MFRFVAALFLFALEWLLGMVVVIAASQVAFWAGVPSPEWISVWGAIAWTFFILWQVERGLHYAFRSPTREIKRRTR